MENRKLCTAIACVLYGYGASAMVASDAPGDNSNSTQSPNPIAPSQVLGGSQQNPLEHGPYLIDPNNDAGGCNIASPTQNTCAPSHPMRALTADEIKSIQSTRRNQAQDGIHPDNVTSSGTFTSLSFPTTPTHGSCTANGCNVTASPPPSEPPQSVPPPTTGHPPTGEGASSNATCFAPLTPLNRANSAEVFANEGGVHSTGYVLPGASNAGVTIGAGVDLGQNGVSDFQAMGVPQSIINALTPWIGYKGSAASTIVAQIGEPVLSAADANTLSVDAFNYYTNEIASKFNTALAATNNAYTFSQLPEDTQTAIVDVTYPNGPNLQTSAPNFWGDVIKGQWLSAVGELSDWYNNPSQKNPQRYTNDAHDIQADINKNSIPQNDIYGICP